MAMHDRRRDSVLAWAGLVAGPGAVVVHQQLGTALATAGWACAHGAPWVVPAVGLAAALLALAGALASWRVWRRAAGGHRFAAGLSAAFAGFLVLVIVAQSIPGFVFTGCER